MRPLFVLLSVSAAALGLVLCFGFSGGSCDAAPAASASGLSKVSVEVPTGSDGLTTEQRNIANRLLEDNKPGSIKHLYVISAYSGQVLIYSTVQGKVTSSGKRLSPTSVVAARPNSSDNSWYSGFGVTFGNAQMITGEVLQDDGAYGSSADYLYWWDTKGIYHQHYVQGGQILHISSEPIAVKSVVMNMELDQVAPQK